MVLLGDQLIPAVPVKALELFLVESKGRFKYAIGNMISYDDILEFNKKVRVDFKDSFIIAVRKGEIIPLSDALKNNN